MSPKEIHDTLLPEVREQVLLLAAGYPIAQLGQELENFSNYFQGLAIAHLLRSADVEQFTLYLTRSAHARRYFLRRSAREGNAEDPRLALGRTEAFLDALAANQIDLARDIARLSGHAWHGGWEYEDDFCYFLFLHQLVSQDGLPDTVGLGATLARFESALEGGKSLRLEVCRALLERDDEAFQSGLFALLEQRREELFNLRERMQQVEPMSCVCWARSFLCIEGFALMRVAELVGLLPLDRDAEMPLCPSLGRVASAPNPYEDIFEGIERERARAL
jgi:hypothetical protein